MVVSEETPYGVRISTRDHALRGDEPADHGGADTGLAPFGLHAMKRRGQWGVLIP